MNAGRDVERLLSTWLAEEAADRSRDRVLTEVHQAVNRMPQRRFGAAWRNPMFLNPVRAAMVAAAVVLAAIGGAVVGRATAPPGVGSAGASAVPGASVAPAGPSIEDYRNARNTICGKYQTLASPFKATVEGIFEPSLPAADEAIKVKAMTDLVGVTEALVEELGAMQPPSSLVADHAVNVADFREINTLLRAALRRAELGDLVGAQALGVATDPLSASIAAFEKRYSLVRCP